MAIFICKTCGTSFEESPSPPKSCPICSDDRQFVPRTGQEWTTRESLQSRHANLWKQHEPQLFEIRTTPKFGIGQRAFLLALPDGNYLWDCIALLDDATRHLIHAMGGLKGIAISHPHYYTTMQDWAEEFDAPVYLHADDREWVMRPHQKLQFWDGETLQICDDIQLIRLGGHFPGGTVLHWSSTHDGQPVLMSGDIVQVASDTTRVSFLYSYPNMIPLSAHTVQRIGQKLATHSFDRIYGAFEDREVLANAGEVVARSVRTYLDHLRDEDVDR
ncbi:MBL fold metallo-hydrolase [Thalassoglobus sp. JC818]|uniref:MBL fold metallo-hydrolase n=1 Tax=Thalassoglobus sp. JC818 TaxID=3232136 RepID=UPI0034580A4F